MKQKTGNLDCRAKTSITKDTQIITDRRSLNK